MSNTNTTFEFLRDFKGPRTLSFKNWRYRLLHWFFNVRPTDPDDAVANHGMNRSFYTHYCPLFHFTNLIAILFLPILVVKIGIRAFKATVYISYILGKINLHLPNRKAKEETKENKHKNEIFQFIKELKMHFSQTEKGFDYFWDFFCCYKIKNELLLTKEEAKELWEKYKLLIEEARENSKLRTDRMRERVIFWTNFSRVFIKGFLNLLYIGLTLFVGWLFWLYAGTVLSGAWSLIKFIFNINVFSFFLTAVEVLLFLTFFGFLLILTWKLAGKQIDYLLEGLVGAITNLFSYFGRIIENVTEFISVFYEENCPPINIVSEEEAIILELEGEE